MKKNSSCDLQSDGAAVLCNVGRRNFSLLMQQEDAASSGINNP